MKAGQVVVRLRMREALIYAFDFEWTNKSIMYGSYERTHSVFQSSNLMAVGKPSADELALLGPFRGKVSDEVFGEPFVPPVSDGSGQDRAGARVLARRHTDQHLVERPARQQVRLLDRLPAGKLQFRAAALPHPWSPEGSLAAMPADLVADQAPSMGPPVGVALVALATKLFRVNCQHRLDRRGPSPQAQPVEVALELFKPLDHQRRQRQRSRRQRRPLVHPLQCGMFRHGVDLLALGLRFATSSLAA